MLRQIVNQCRLVVQLSTVDPVLIKAGASNTRDIEMAAVRTVRDGAEEVFLPGSSLKGAIRSHCERIARTLNDMGACDPLARSGPLRACGDMLDEREHPRPGAPRPPAGATGSVASYRDSCPICRLFGTSHMSSRVSFGDGLLVGGSKPSVSVRDGIGIDRFTGGAASRIRYEAEVVSDGAFEFDVSLRNFELAQLGLVRLALRDLMSGQLRLGAGKSRGLGRMSGTLASCEVAYIGARPEDEMPSLLGAGNVWHGAAAYGFPANDSVFVEGGAYERVGVRTVLRTSGGDLPWDALERLAVEALEQYTPTPAALRARQPGGGDFLGRTAAASPRPLGRQRQAQPTVPAVAVAEAPDTMPDLDDPAAGQQQEPERHDG